MLLSSYRLSWGSPFLNLTSASSFVHFSALDRSGAGEIQPSLLMLFGYSYKMAAPAGIRCSGWREKRSGSSLTNLLRIRAIGSSLILAVPKQKVFISQVQQQNSSLLTGTLAGDPWTSSLI